MTLDELAKQHGVASLELSKELAKAGMPQKSVWWWVKLSSIEKDYDKWELCLKMRDYKEPTFEWFINPFTEERYYPDDIEECYSAFHSGELADVLPEFCLGGKTPDGWFNCWKFDNMCLRNIEYYCPFQADTLPNALAKMVLYLLDKGILKKEDL